MTIDKAMRHEAVLTSYVKQVDAIFIHGSTMEELEEQFVPFSVSVGETTSPWLPRWCKLPAGVYESFVFTVFCVSACKCGQDSGKMSAILQFPAPQNQTELKSWLSLTVQFIWRAEFHEGAAGSYILSGPWSSCI